MRTQRTLNQTLNQTQRDTTSYKDKGESERVRERGENPFTNHHFHYSKPSMSQEPSNVSQIIIQTFSTMTDDLEEGITPFWEGWGGRKKNSLIRDLTVEPCVGIKA